MLPPPAPLGFSPPRFDVLLSRAICRLKLGERARGWESCLVHARTHVGTGACLPACARQARRLNAPLRGPAPGDVQGAGVDVDEAITLAEQGRTAQEGEDARKLHAQVAAEAAKSRRATQRRRAREERRRTASGRVHT